MTDLKRGFNDNAYEVKTDNKTVWINRKYGCVARFAPGGVEFIVPDIKKPVINTSDKPKVRTWSRFKRLVAEWYGFELDDIWCPLWITEDAK